MMQIRNFPLDESLIARSIYKSEPHVTTTTGIVLSSHVRGYFESVLEGFIRHAQCPEDSYFRIDAFVEYGCLRIIEINAECQEGWGISLNLLHAAGGVLAHGCAAYLPEEIVAYSDAYLPEFELAASEARRYSATIKIVPSAERPGVPSRTQFDNKLYLARYSRIWHERSALTRVPLMYTVNDTPWDRIPHNVVFKRCTKYAPDGTALRQSVVRRADIGKGRFIRSCYEAEDAIAQDWIEPLALSNGSVTQVILMCKGARVVTGYLQVAPPGTFIINDRSAKKGPLVFG